MCLAIPGKVVDIQEGELRMGRVAFGQVMKEVSLAFVPKAALGDYVIVHAGMALEVLDEENALKVLEAFAELDEIEQREGIR